ncbi:glycosyltransferase family 4 protein [Pseudonocardia acidicola]|uniref:Glycosyltransferase family 4 protein n=1 Tax=Pseudonocardia acidicola TaxID=2724939 RepID=A0ABX1S774_9PSEU|nr:glycosyltransferase family 1 protein [Pseudonocardia acidicola]NMH97415.1 glycosyltransferase family 4 protein [Pseudonocardia acidicola]
MGIRLLLDATAIPAERGGVGRYVDNLVVALAAEGADVVVACQRRDAAAFDAAGATVHPLHPVGERRPVRLAWEQSGLPLLAHSVRADVVHCPHYTMPLVPGRPVVVTLHDVTFFSDPGRHLAHKAVFFRAATRHAVRSAAVCIVPSEVTRSEVTRWAGPVRCPLEVVPHGVDGSVFHPPTAAERAASARRLGVRDGHYLAFLGAFEPRKNVPALIRGWVQACRGLADPPPLALAGGAGWDREVAAAQALVPAPLQLIRVGYLPAQQLRALLGGAALVVYPSHGEGFGLPVLEAMACGGTVLTTRRLALPEVGGDAVAYCGTRPEEIAAALCALLADPGRRAALAAAARERARGFTWQACARTHLAVYERAASRAGSATGGVRTGAARPVFHAFFRLRAFGGRNPAGR